MLYDPFGVFKKSSDQGTLEIVDLLVEYGASLEEKLHSAPTVEIAEYLVGKGGKIDEYDEKGMSPLMHAAVRENIATTSYLLEHGADRNGKTTKGATYEEKSSGFYPQFYANKTHIPAGSTAAKIAEIFSNGAIKGLIEGS